jgi:hypothetical protein
VRLTADGDHAAVSGDGEEEEDVPVEGWCQQFSSHSIGDLQFDSSGNLYASGSDGGDANNADLGERGWPNKNQLRRPAGGDEEPLTAKGARCVRRRRVRPTPSASPPTRPISTARRSGSIPIAAKAFNSGWPCDEGPAPNPIYKASG